MHATWLSSQCLAAIWKEAEAKGQRHMQPRPSLNSLQLGLALISDPLAVTSQVLGLRKLPSHHFILSPGLCAYVLVF